MCSFTPLSCYLGELIEAACGATSSPSCLGSTIYFCSLHPALRNQHMLIDPIWLEQKYSQRGTVWALFGLGYFSRKDPLHWCFGECANWLLFIKPGYSMIDPSRRCWKVLFCGPCVCTDVIPEHQRCQGEHPDPGEGTDWEMPGFQGKPGVAFRGVSTTSCP